MKRLPKIGLAAVLAAGGASCAYADWKAVDEYERLFVDVAANESLTETSNVWVNTGAEFSKFGAGEYVLPLSRLASLGANGQMNVLGGTLKVTEGEPQDFSEWPAGIPEPALWLDANVNLSSTNGGDKAYVTAWHDRRETKSAAPFDYAWAAPLWLDPSKDGVSGTYLQPEVQSAGGNLKSIYFQGYRSGVLMNLVKNDRASFSANADRHCVPTVHHAFVVHGVFKTQGFVLSGTSRFYHPGSTNGLTNDAVFSSNQDNVSAANNIRVYQNGRRIYPDVEKPLPGYQLMELDFRGGMNGYFSSLYSDNNIRPSANSGESAHIGGDNVCEVIAFSKRLTTEQRAAVTKYLMAKWGLEGQEKGRLLANLADGTVLEAADGFVATRGAFRVSGNGTVTPDSGKTMEFGCLHEKFAGRVKLASGQSALLKDDAPALELDAGSSVKVRKACGGMRVEVSAAADDTLAVDAGESTDRAFPVQKTGFDSNAVTLRAVPAGVKKINVTGGKLVIRPEAESQETYAAGAAVANGNFEAGNFSKGRSGTIPNWSYTVGPKTKAGNGWMMEWSRRLNLLLDPEGTWKSYSWLSDYDSPEGDYVAVLSGGGTFVSDAFEIPSGGVYDLSYFAIATMGYSDTKAHPVLETSLVSADGATTNRLGNLWVFSNLGYVRYRLRSPELAAGSYRIQITHQPPENGSCTYLLDDVRLERVNVEPNVWAIPNGGFELLSSRESYGAFGISTDYATEGWTFTQGDWSGGKSTKPGVALAAYGATYSGNILVNAAADWRFGNIQLVMLPNGGTASTTFSAPAAGRYYLRAALAKFRATLDGVNMKADAVPDVAASVSVNGGSAVSLGNARPVSMRHADCTWPVSFAVAAGDSVTLTVGNVSAKNLGVTADDFVLVPEETFLKDDERIANGHLADTSGAGWTNHHENEGKDPEHAKEVGTVPWARDKSAVSIRKGPGSPVYYGSDFLPDEPMGHFYLIDYAYVSQNLTFPKAGRYRLRYCVRGRSTEAETPTYRYSTNCTMKVFMKYGDGDPVQIDETYAPYTNFVAHTAYFTVPEGVSAGEIQFGRVNDPLVSGGRDQGICLDAVSVVYAGPAPARTPLVLPEDTVIDVAEGAKLELDVGNAEAIRVKEVKLGGRRRYGVISAATCPDYITGTGCLWTEKPGMTILVR